MKKVFIFGVALVLGFVASAATIKSGDSIAVVFLGECGTRRLDWNHYWYMNMCESAFKANELDIKIIPSDISGNAANDRLLAYLKSDILDKKPNCMLLSYSLRDLQNPSLKKSEVGQDGNFIVSPEYKKNIIDIVDKAYGAGVKVTLLTMTMRGEDCRADENARINAYNDSLREIAKNKGCKLVDLNAEAIKAVKEFRAAVKPVKAGKDYIYPNFVTTDGTHMNFIGYRMMAMKILKDGFGFNDAELEKSDEAIKKSKVTVAFWVRPAHPYHAGRNIKITGRDFLRLDDLARKNKTCMYGYIKEKLIEGMWVPRAESFARKAIEEKIMQQKQ